MTTVLNDWAPRLTAPRFWLQIDHEQRGLGAAFVDQVADVAGKLFDVIVTDAFGCDDRL